MLAPLRVFQIIDQSDGHARGQMIVKAKPYVVLLRQGYDRRVIGRYATMRGAKQAMSKATKPKVYVV